MATTTATLTLDSADLLTDALSLSATQTLYKAGTTTGLDGIQYERMEVATGDIYDIVGASTYLISSTTPAGTEITADKAHKLYIANKHTDETKYVDVYISSQNIGRLYAGDWMFIPLEAALRTQDVAVEAVSANQVIEWALIHEGKTLGAQ